MGTMFALFLVLSTLAGCASEGLVNVRNALPSAPALTFAVEVKPYEGQVLDEDGTLLAEYAYELPVMRVLLEDGSDLAEAVLPEQEQALAAAETFNAAFSQWKDNAQTLAVSAEEDQAFRKETGLEPVAYTDDLRCTVYQTERLVSVRGFYSTYTGGAHPNSILMSWNFDVEAGEFFEPDILDEDTNLREYVHMNLINQARQTAAGMGIAPEDYYWEDYSAILKNWSSYAVSFDEDGMTIGFSPYELGAYVLGPQVFKIPYEGALYAHLGEHGRALLGLAPVAEEAAE